MPESKRRCLACGEVYPAILAACPSRYLSPHGEDFMAIVAEELEADGCRDGCASREMHEAAIRRARERSA